MAQHPLANNSNFVMRSFYINGYIPFGMMIDEELTNHVENYFDYMEWPEGHGYGSSDRNADLFHCLKAFGIEMDVVDGSYERTDGFEAEGTWNERMDKLDDMAKMFAPL